MLLLFKYVNGNIKIVLKGEGEVEMLISGGKKFFLFIEDVVLGLFFVYFGEFWYGFESILSCNLIFMD